MIWHYCLIFFNHIQENSMLGGSCSLSGIHWPDRKDNRELWKKTAEESALEQKMELAWTHVEKK